MSDLDLVRIPLDDIDRIVPEPTFGRMPILYLELLENKRKVHRDLVNKPYEPRVVEDVENEEKDEEEDPQPESVEERSDEPEDVPEPNNDTLSAMLGDEEDEPQQIHTPPTLRELQNRNPRKTIIRKEYKYLHEDDEDTIKERNDVYFQYEVLKRMHPGASIPEFTQYSDPKLMAQKYDMLAKKLSLDSSVDSWKRYMIIFVMGCEVVLGKLNFDVEGFAQQQIMSMNTYDQLLVEMAEKSYVPTGQKWPVEIRLLMMLTMNVVLFIVSKLIMKRTGTNLLGTINDLSHSASRKMRDPES